MQLYVKKQVGKTTRYVPYVAPDNSMHEIDNRQMVTLLATLTLSMLMSVEKQLPDHAKVAVEIRRTEDAVARLAKLVALPLDETLVRIGTHAWNSAINSMQQGLQEAPDA